ncbi:DNA cytosine methyltransferase [Paenibacillus sp. S-38]|uniref:DNA cytosine methyltransferase n=1 Tax=Paenibacillus sp. S-38 TaxID=3416710 RepID=UPI003CEA24E0
MRAISLFTGGGGLDLAAEWAGIRTVAMCEREPFPRAVLQRHWPNVPIYDDVCTLTATRLKEDGIIGPRRTIDVIHGGFPCQPFSNAGKRGGTEDDRYLWPQMFRIISEVRPAWVVAENVDGLLSMEQSDSYVVMEDETTLCEETEMVLETIRRDFAEEGYETITIVLPVAGVGAPHRRYRVLIVGHTECSGCDWESWRRTGPQLENRHRDYEGRFMADSSIKRLSEWRRTGLVSGTTENEARVEFELERFGQNVADATGKRCGEARENQCRGSTERTAGCSEDVADSSGSRRQERDSSSEPEISGYNSRSCDERRARRAVKSGMGGMLDGISDWLDRYRPRNIRLRSDGGLEVLWPAAMGQSQYEWEPPRVASGIKNRTGRLKLLGNAVSPAHLYPIFTFIKQIHNPPR